MKEIKLTKDKVALVDDEDFEYLSQYKWYAFAAGNTFYAAHKIYYENGEKATILLHNAIIGISSNGFECDHIDGNGLNNKRSNLRLVTHRQNMQNRHDQKSSKYPGVYWVKKKSNWMARIQINGKRKYLGSYLSEEEAFKIYRKAVENLGDTVVRTV
jgi:hypothetical protein